MVCSVLVVALVVLATVASCWSNSKGGKLNKFHSQITVHACYLLKLPPRLVRFYWKKNQLGQLPILKSVESASITGVLDVNPYVGAFPATF